MRLPAGDFEKNYALNSVNWRARYHEQRLAVQCSHTTAASKDNRQDSTHLMGAVQVEYTKVEPLRRLSPGDISLGFRKLWEV
jgi:hypothetical protein